MLAARIKYMRHLLALSRSSRKEEQSVPYRVCNLHEQEGTAHLGKRNGHPNVSNAYSNSRYEISLSYEVGRELSLNVMHHRI